MAALDRNFGGESAKQFLSAAALCFVVVILGCSKESPPPNLPTTFPVDGKVLLSNGQPLTEGLVQFQSTVKPSITSTGSVKPDGSFSIITFVDGNQCIGTIEGPHQVTIIRPSPDQSVPPTVLAKKFQVETKENHFEIRLER